MLMYGRNQYNIVNQLASNKKKIQNKNLGKKSTKSEALLNAVGVLKKSYPIAFQKKKITEIESLVKTQMNELHIMKNCKSIKKKKHKEKHI